MTILDKYTIPTGYLFTGEYSKGKLETLTIGDYGKRHNVKADFLGFTDVISGVPNTHCMPLSEKWVITVSTQYGCPMKCTFCDVPQVKFRGNATFKDLQDQLYHAISLFSSGTKYTERLNLHYARMGDPIFNENVFEFSRWMYANKRQIAHDTGLSIETLHPVLTTSLPKKFKQLKDRIYEWVDIKNNVYNGQAGLQFSINSTDDAQRDEMFGGMALDLESFSKLVEQLPDPISRKYCLNFAYSTDFVIDAKKVASLFDSNKFMCKITPIHNNNACRDNDIKTIGGYDSWQPYQKPEQDLRDAGFDVLVFVPSLDEEQGLVTCGNAVLGGSKMNYDEGIIKIQGL